MDKYEYKLKLEELTRLVESQDYPAAAQIADGINWKKVRNAKTLVMVSQIYEQMGQYEACKEVLLQAYDHSSIGRSIVSRLAEIAIKSKNIPEAEEYYNEFLEISPRDSQRYVIAYKISCLKDEPLSTRIAILEELKEKEYTEVWAYELAVLYAKAELGDKCVAICDELILWFGEGEYVEKALDLKRGFQPLTTAQEEKYRSLRQQDCAVEISLSKAREDAAEETTTIKASKFNTQYLQEELERNMQQIQVATNKETVRETMDNIKKIVSEIPYLTQEDEPSIDHHTINEKVDESIQADFQELLAEEDDGQITLNLPDMTIEDGQIAGQMSIQDVLAEWEKTKVAAEAAIRAAEEKKLVLEKESALAEANEIMNRLQALLPLLSAAPEELVAEPETEASKLLAETPMPEAEDAVEETGAEETQPESETVSGREEEAIADALAAVMLAEAQAAAVEMDETADAEISEAAAEAAAEISETVAEAAAEIDETAEEIAAEIGETAAEAAAEISETAAEAAAEMDETAANSEKNAEIEDSEDTQPAEADEENAAEMESPQADLEAAAAADTEAEATQASAQEGASVDAPAADADAEEEAALAAISAALSAELGAEEAVNAVAQENPGAEAGPLLSRAEMRELFSYFLPVPGIREQVERILADAAGYKSNAITSLRGNLIIQGEEGSGKTVFATSLIRALQKVVGNEEAKIGKISAASLNRKDFAALVPKIAGGYLIIEKAGELTAATAVRMSQIMERNTQGMVVILEDDSAGINRVMGLDFSFAKKFTGKVKIPIFTIDELVAFGKSYAQEMECVIEEMGVLAMYNRINNIQKLDRATTLAEVKDIVDQAIERAESGGLKKLFTKKYNENDYLILREKDFE